MQVHQVALLSWLNHIMSNDRYDVDTLTQRRLAAFVPPLPLNPRRVS